VNKIEVIFNNQAKDLVIPLESSWDFYGQQEGVEKFEESVLEQIINKDQDFEVTRFEHKSYYTNVKEETSINYEFWLYNPTLINTNTSIPALSGTWENSYTSKFLNSDIYYQKSNFKKSFWKLDFYDTPNNINQKAYITIILPTHQGLLQTTQLGFFQNVLIKKPKYVLDYLGDKEGFFIYWLKKRNYLDINTFYMSAKFFNGNTGQFIRMLNRPQYQLTNTSDPFSFSQEDYFYYRVNLDYSAQKYEVYKFPNIVRVGTETEPIKWYEYVNPT
jgi:hypothetical protein